RLANPLALANRQLAHRRFIHQPIQQRQPPLLGWRGTVQVSGLGGHEAFLSAIPSAAPRAYLFAVQTQLRPVQRPLERVTVRRNPRAARITFGVMAVVATGLFL